MISKYIKELIENNNRIIIPDFGAFMVQNSPEGKQISFNDFLKFNDGLLINQIIKAEKINKNQATDNIKDYVKLIEDQFAKGASFNVEGVGYLIKDEQGNIRFDSSVPSTKSDSTSPTDEKPVILLDEKSTVTAKTSKAEDKKEEEPKKNVEPTKMENKTEGASTPKPSIPAAPKPTASKPTPGKPGSTSYQSRKSSKSPLNMIILISAIVIVLAGGTWAFLSFDMMKYFKKQAPPMVVEQPVVADTVAEDTTYEEPKVIEEVTPEMDPNARRYYVIAGSFKVSSNADRYQQKLISQGYTSEIIERKNGFRAVSYKTLYDRKEAFAEWRTMRKTDPETWILIK